MEKELKVVNIQGIKGRRLIQAAVTREADLRLQKRRAESSGTNRQWNRPGSVSTAGCRRLAELGSQEECLDFHLQSLSDLVWGGPMPLVDDMNVQPGPRKTLGRGNSTGRQWERRAHE